MEILKCLCGKQPKPVTHPYGVSISCCVGSVLQEWHWRAWYDDWSEDKTESWAIRKWNWSIKDRTKDENI